MSLSFYDLMWVVGTLALSLSIWVIAIVVAVIRWKLHPRVSAIVAACAVAVILLEVVSTGLRVFVHPMLFEHMHDWSSDEITILFSLESLVVNLAFAATYAALFAAIFSARKAPA